MAEIINLRNVRKQKARAEKDTLAEANRMKFGRTKGEKALDAAQKARADRHIDGHKKED